MMSHKMKTNTFNCIQFTYTGRLNLGRPVVVFEGANRHPNPSDQKQNESDEMEYKVL